MACDIRKVGRVCFAAVLAIGVAASVSAASAAEPTVTYICRLTSSQSKSWIPKVLFIGHNAAQNRVVVSDPIVLFFNDRIPVEGRVTNDSARRITFVWGYFARDSRGIRAKMKFRATWLKSSQKMQVTATASGYSKRFNGAGTCEKATL